MHFIYWLLQRVKRSIFSNRRWYWVDSYRRMILKDKAVSIVATTLVGAILVGSVVLGALASGATREVVSTVADTVAMFVPIFYVYHWIAALYDVYTNEKMATWNTLKNK